MANEGRLAREAAIAAMIQAAADTAARLAREAAVVGHHFPEDLTEGRIASFRAVVAISRIYGVEVVNDPAEEFL